MAHLHARLKLLAARVVAEAQAPSAPISEMPIQILRAIFVAIKYYVFGLMAQKYSISGRRGELPRRDVTRNTDKFGGVLRARAGLHE